jgi:hypothetical protein
MASALYHSFAADPFRKAYRLVPSWTCDDRTWLPTFYLYCGDFCATGSLPFTFYCRVCCSWSSHALVLTVKQPRSWHNFLGPTMDDNAVEAEARPGGRTAATHPRLVRGGDRAEVGASFDDDDDDGGGGGEPLRRPMLFCQFIGGATTTTPTHPGAGPPPPPTAAALREQGGDAGDEDNENLQRLIYLAKLPYCRVTKVFGTSSSPPTNIASPNATSPSDRRTVVQVSPNEEEPRVEDKQAFIDDEEDDDDDDMDVDASCADEAPMIVNHEPSESGADAAEADTSSDHDREESGVMNAEGSREELTPAPIDYPERRRIFRTRARILVEENQAFVAANYGPADRGFRTCRICHASVCCPDRRTLLRHAVSLGCLVRRVESDAAVGRTEEDTAQGVAAAVSASAKTLPCSTSGAPAKGQRLVQLRRAVEEFWGRRFDPAGGGGLVLSAAADAAVAAASSTTTRGRRRCRQCHGMVSGTQTTHFLAHLAACTGIVPLVRDLGDVIRTALSGPLIASPPEEYAPGVAATRDGMECEEDGDDHFVEDHIDASNDTEGEAAVPGNHIELRASPTSVEVPTPINDPDGRRRRRRSVYEENLAFLEAHFGSVAPSGARTCGVCNVPVHPSTPSILLRHAVTLECLVQRGQNACFGRKCPPNRRSVLLRRVLDAVEEYWVRRFDPDAAAPGRWKCRRCHGFVRGCHNALFVYHLAACTGVVPLVRDLEEISRSAVSAVLGRPPPNAAATAPSSV